MTNSLLCSAALLVGLGFIVTPAAAQRVDSPTGIHDLFFIGAAAGDNFGWSVSSAGDEGGTCAVGVSCLSELPQPVQSGHQF